MIYLILLLVYITVDAAVDKGMIEKRKNVHTLGQYILRGSILILWALLWNKGWQGVLANCLFYWFTFDTLINLFRGLRATYLSEKGIDGFQRDSLGEGPWFFWKFILAAGSAAYLINPNLFVYQP